MEDFKLFIVKIREVTGFMLYWQAVVSASYMSNLSKFVWMRKIKLYSSYFHCKINALYLQKL